MAENKGETSNPCPKCITKEDKGKGIPREEPSEQTKKFVDLLPPPYVVHPDKFFKPEWRPQQAPRNLSSGRLPPSLLKPATSVMNFYSSYLPQHHPSSSVRPPPFILPNIACGHLGEGNRPKNGLPNINPGSLLRFMSNHQFSSSYHNMLVPAGFPQPSYGPFPPLRNAVIPNYFVPISPQLPSNFNLSRAPGMMPIPHPCFPYNSMANPYVFQPYGSQIRHPSSSSNYRYVYEKMLNISSPQTDIEVGQSNLQAIRDQIDWRIFKCNKCSLEFPNAQAFGGHMSSHSKSKRSRELLMETVADSSKRPKTFFSNVEFHPTTTKNQECEKQRKNKEVIVVDEEDAGVKDDEDKVVEQEVQNEEENAVVEASKEKSKALDRTTTEVGKMDSLEKATVTKEKRSSSDESITSEFRTCTEREGYQSKDQV